MALSIGIVGLPNVGKSTLFEIITKKEVDKSNYPFSTIEPNIGIVAVLDDRVDKLAELTQISKKIYPTIEFIDIAGLVAGASKGEGLGNKFLAHIRNTDAIVYVLRIFKNEKVIGTQITIDPLFEKEILDTELILKDLETIEKRFKELEKKIKINKELVKEFEVVKKTKKLLEEGEILAEENFNEEEKRIIKNYQLLTFKSRVYLLNGKEEEIEPKVIEEFKNNNLSFLVIDLASELEMVGFSKEERKEFGLPEESKIDLLIKKSYQLLDLITFLTIGSDEVRGWTAKKGTKAPQAGGIIHSDFEKNFIKAEVINWKDLINASGLIEAREKGLVRTEGKEYIVQDGDVIKIKT